MKNVNESTEIISKETLVNTVKMMATAAKNSRKTVIDIPAYAVQWMFLGVIDYGRSFTELKTLSIPTAVANISSPIYTRRMIQSCKNCNRAEVRAMMYADMRTIIDQLL